MTLNPSAQLIDPPEQRAWYLLGGFVMCFVVSFLLGLVWVKIFGADRVQNPNAAALFSGLQFVLGFLRVVFIMAFPALWIYDHTKIKRFKHPERPRQRAWHFLAVLAACMGGSIAAGVAYEAIMLTREGIKHSAIEMLFSSFQMLLAVGAVVSLVGFPLMWVYDHYQGKKIKSSDTLN